MTVTASRRRRVTRPRRLVGSRHVDPESWDRDAEALGASLSGSPTKRLRTPVKSLSRDLEILDGIAQKTAHAEAAELDLKGGWPTRTMAAIKKDGLAGWVVPSEYGGRGHGLLGLAQATAVLGSKSASASIVFGMHSVASAVIAAKATPEQARAYLTPIVHGEHITTLALSEPGTGIHFYYPKTRLRDMRDGTLCADGEKSFVTSGGYADSYVVSTTSIDPDAPAGIFSCVLVDGNAAGVTWGPKWEGMGMRGNSSRGCELSNVYVPATDLLGADGDQLWYIFHVITPYFLVAMAGTYVGIAERALELAIGSVQDRRYSHLSRPISAESVLQHRLGTMWAVVARTRALLRCAAKAADRGDTDALPALCSAKAAAAECAVSVVRDALAVGGGRAYAANSEIGRLQRDAAASHVMSPTTDILKTWTGRSLLGLPVLDPWD